MSAEWLHHQNLADLLEWMLKTDRLRDCAHAIHVVRHPREYPDLWREMQAAQKEAGRIITESRSMPDDGSLEQIQDEVYEFLGVRS